MSRRGRCRTLRERRRVFRCVSGGVGFLGFFIMLGGAGGVENNLAGAPALGVVGAIVMLAWVFCSGAWR